MVIVMKRLICMFRRNDIVIRIYLSFIVVLAVTVALIGIIFMRLYETNYMRSYTKTLSRQCSVIAGRVGKLAAKGQEGCGFPDIRRISMNCRGQMRSMCGS